MVNRYDNPAEAKFINTYVPIPFEQLLTFGQQAQADMQQVNKEWNDTLDKWADFQSPSDIDTQAWYDETYGRALPVAEEMARNIDMLKTAEGRAKIYSIINTTDRAKLSRLRQSAAGMLTRQEAERQLMKNNQYNLDWHGFDYAHYNTEGQGIFNDTALIPYMSVPDLVKPYVEDLKASDMGRSGGWLYTGVSPERTAAQVNAHISDILRTPQANEHISAMIRSGMSREDAQQAFVLQALNAANEFSYVNRTADPYAMLSARNAGSGSGNQQPIVAPSRWMEIYADQGNKKRDVLESTGIRFSENTTADDVTAGIISLYQDAMTGEHADVKMKNLINRLSTKIDVSEANKILDVANTKDNAIHLNVQGRNVDTYPVAPSLMRDAVFFTAQGIPASDFSKAFLANNNGDLKLDMPWFASNRGRDQYLNAIENYGDLMRDFAGLVSPVFAPSGDILPYDNLVDGVKPEQLIRGTGYISEEDAENAFKQLADSGRYGDLSWRDIRRLFTKGINEKHKILKQVDGKLVGDSSTSTYYEFTGGIPIGDEASRAYYDTNYQHDVYGGSNSYKSYPTIINYSYDTDNRSTSGTSSNSSL